MLAVRPAPEPYFPLVTSILLSVALSLMLYAVSRFRR